MTSQAPGEAAAELLERGHELRMLDDALTTARAGAGGLVLIEGPAGIGKTALLASARRRARGAGLSVASARASELERQLDFGVVRQLFEPAVTRADAAARAELLGGAAALAEPIVAPRTALPDASSPATHQAFAAFHGLYWLCSNLAQAGPLLLAVDDAHWADLASLRFLHYLAQRIEDLPVVLAVASRRAETPAEEELLARLVTDPRATRIALAPLSRAAVATLVRAHLGPHAEPAFADACHAASGGTPFLVRELLRELAERGVEPVAAAADRVGEIGPRTVARTVVARVRGLAPGAQALARAAAVLGPDAEPHRVARLAGMEAPQAGAVLDALRVAGILAPGRPVEFTHPILRTAVHGEMPDGERARLHARAAELLAGEGLGEERVAGHLLATEPNGDRRTVDLLLRTARGSLARGAPRSAVSYLERALHEPPEPGMRVEVLHRLGCAETQTGSVGAAIEHLREARRLAADPGRRLPIARDLAAALSIQGRFAAAVEVVEELLRTPGAIEEDAVLSLRADLLMMTTLGPPSLDRGPATPPDTVATAVRGASPGARNLLAALALRAALHLRPAAEARDLAERARRAGIVEELGSGAISWSQALHVLIAADGFATAEAMLDEAFEWLGTRPSGVGSTRAYMARAFLHLRRGAVREAIADGRTAVDAGREMGFSGWPHGLAVLIDALVEHGQCDAAEHTLSRTGMAGDIPESFAPNDRLLAARGRLRLAQGRTAEAIADLDELTRRTDRRGIANPSLFDQRPALALALLRGGDRSGAAALAEEQLTLARRWGAPWALGVAERTSGLCAGGERGLALLRASAGTLERSGARLEHARSLVELGAAIRRSGERSAAREPLRRGMELAHRCGAPPLVERAREELLATGARPRRITRTGVAALTASELRVARMAAAGMTNREIAQALFVTARTVEGHLTHAFAKLGVASRSELPQRLATED